MYVYMCVQYKCGNHAIKLAQPYVFPVGATAYAKTNTVCRNQSALVAMRIRVVCIRAERFPRKPVFVALFVRLDAALGRFVDSTWGILTDGAEFAGGGVYNETHA